MTTLTTIPPTLTRKLSRLRRSIYRFFICDGLAWVFCTAVGLAFVSLLIDRLFRMDRSQRIIMLVIMLGVLAWVIWSKLVRPLLTPLSTENIAMAVERRHPELADALISALQFSSQADPAATGASPVLVRAAIDRGVQTAEPVPFDDVVDRRTSRRNISVAAAAAVLFGVAILLFPGLFGRWAERNLLLADTPWPQDTHLSIEGVVDGVLIMPRGDNLTVTVNVEGEIPRLVHLDFVPEGGRRSTEQMRMLGEEQFVANFRNVIEEMRLRARGGDDPGRWVDVRLVERPDIVRDQSDNVLGLALRVSPPAYTGKADNEMPFGQSVYNILAGSTVTVVGYATKPLASATLKFGNEWQQPMEIGPAPEQSVQLSRKTEETVRTATYPAGQRRFTAVIPPEQLRTGAYTLTMEDTDGLSIRHPVRITVRVDEDRRPSIRVVPEGIGDMITPEAVVPLRIEMSDDFAITDAKLVYVTNTLDGSGNTEPEALDIPEFDGLLPAAEPDIVRHRLEVERLILMPDSILTLHVTATDNDTYDPEGPKTGESASIGMNVVTGAELREELLRREQEQRMEFERVVSDQQQYIVESRALAAALGQGDPFDAQARRTLVDLEKKQRLAAGRSNAIADAFDQILAEVINNRLEESGGPMEQRLRTRIIQPLRYIAMDPVPDAADALDQAAAVTIDDADRLAMLNDAIEQQQAVLEEMTLVLNNMVKMEGFQEAINLLREVIRQQEDINEKTEKELESRIEDIFD